VPFIVAITVPDVSTCVTVVAAGIVGLLSICATPLVAFQSALTCAAGITVVSGKAPTSTAVYVGLVAAFAQAGTVGSVSV